MIKKKITFKKLLCVIMALTCAFSSVMLYSFNAFAQEPTLEELQEKYNDIEKEIEEDEKKLSSVQDDIRTNEEKLDDLTSQIDNIEEQIDLLDESIGLLNDDIDDLQNDIDVTNKDIEDINAEIAEIEKQMAETEILMEETKELLLTRIRENYMAGGNGTTLELLFSSGDMSSFFARKELVTRVNEEDNELIAELSEKLVELNELQKESEAQKAELEGKKTELDTQMNSLTDKQTDLKGSLNAQEKKKSDATDRQDEVKYLIEELDKDSEAYKAAIKRKEAERDALDAEIDAYIKEHGSSEGEEPKEEFNNDGNMIWPVPGATRMTAGYPTYSSGGKHLGIDIVRTDVTTLGSPFRAAQGGEVILVYNDGNWNQGFGNYCIIDHGDGKMTLYAHAQRINVSKGQVVQKGETIGKIGETGNTTGPHLHFEVRIKKSDGSVSRVNPLNYVTQP